MDAHQRIDELIAATADPVQRATLMLIARFDAALTANTHATERIANAVEEHRSEFVIHTKRFDQHVLDEQKMLASAKGAWWATTVLVIAVIGLGGFIIKSYHENVTFALEGMRDVSTRLRVLESKHEGNNGK
jgi:hypothetical protein